MHTLNALQLMFGFNYKAWPVSPATNLSTPLLFVDSSRTKPKEAIHQSLEEYLFCIKTFFPLPFSNPIGATEIFPSRSHLAPYKAYSYNKLSFSYQSHTSSGQKKKQNQESADISFGRRTHAKLTPMILYQEV
jgi:hypothetical protein